jgi:regulator of protease activity HflC (stomatin/prohibitin superfamily)
MAVLQLGGVTAIVGLTLLVLVLATAYNAVTVVGAEERAVLTVLGEQRRVLEPGLTIVPPFVSQVHRYPVSERDLTVDAQALAADDVPTRVRVTLTLSVKDPEGAFEAGGYERALRDRCRDLLRERVGRTSHEDLAGDRRSVALALRDDLDRVARDRGVRVAAVEVTAVDRTD